MSKKITDIWHLRWPKHSYQTEVNRLSKWAMEWFPAMGRKKGRPRKWGTQRPTYHVIMQYSWRWMGGSEHSAYQCVYTHMNKLRCWRQTDRHPFNSLFSTKMWITGQHRRHTSTICTACIVVWQPRQTADMSTNQRQSFLCCRTTYMEQADDRREAAAVDRLIS